MSAILTDQVMSEFEKQAGIAQIADTLIPRMFNRSAEQYASESLTKGLHPSFEASKPVGINIWNSPARKPTTINIWDRQSVVPTAVTQQIIPSAIKQPVKKPSIISSIGKGALTTVGLGGMGLMGGAGAAAMSGGGNE